MGRTRGENEYRHRGEIKEVRGEGRKKEEEEESVSRKKEN